MSRAQPLARFVQLAVALQKLVEPPDDVLQPLDAMSGLARARELVGLAGEANHDGWDFPVLERPEHHLAAI